MSNSLSVTIDDKALQGMFREFPKIANSEMNRTYRQVASTFMKEFTSRRLRKGVLNIERKGEKFKSRKGQPTLPRKALAAGFVATLFGKESLKAKGVKIKNSNPLVLLREGDTPAKRTVKAKNKPWLYVRIDPKEAFKNEKGRHTKVTKLKWQKWKNKQAKYKGTGGKRVIVAKVKKIGPFPHLGFRKAWRAYKSKLPAHWRKAEDNVIRRAQLKLDRRAA